VPVADPTDREGFRSHEQEANPVSIFPLCFFILLPTVHRLQVVVVVGVVIRRLGVISSSTAI
jgi:hypothetical protein